MHIQNQHLNIKNCLHFAIKMHARTLIQVPVKCISLLSSNKVDNPSLALSNPCQLNPFKVDLSAQGTLILNTSEK